MAVLWHSVFAYKNRHALTHLKTGGKVGDELSVALRHGVLPQPLHHLGDVLLQLLVHLVVLHGQGLQPLPDTHNTTRAAQTGQATSWLAI